MGVEVIEDVERGVQVLICNTADTAFGFIFYEGENVTEFLNWLEADARSYQPVHLAALVDAWRKKMTYAEGLNHRSIFA